MIELDEIFSECLKGYHEASFLLKSPLVLLLIPDLFPFVEIVDLVVKVATWNMSDMVVIFVFVVVVVVVHCFGCLISVIVVAVSVMVVMVMGSVVLVIV